MYGVMGIANAQRHLEQLRSLTEFISQPGIKEVVPMWVRSLPASADFKDESSQRDPGRHRWQGRRRRLVSCPTATKLIRSYYQAYELIRGITGYGKGNGPIIALHEGFKGVAAWDGFLAGADRV